MKSFWPLLQKKKSPSGRLLEKWRQNRPDRTDQPADQPARQDQPASQSAKMPTDLKESFLIKPTGLQGIG